jgi:hypothetical protein
MKSVILREYNDPDSRKMAIQSRPKDAVKLIFVFVKSGQVDYREFENLIDDYVESRLSQSPST